MRESTSTLDLILTRIIDRVVEAVPGATPHNTYLSALPPDNELPPSPDQFVFEVAPGDHWTFDQGHITGAGRNALNTRGLVMVAIHSTVQADKFGHNLKFLTDQSRGIIKRVTNVLGALSDYELRDKVGNELLSEPMRPTQMSIPPKSDRARGYITLAFEVIFDWLVTPEEAPTEDEDSSFESSISSSSSSSLSSSSSSSLSSLSSSSLSSSSSSSSQSSVSSSSSSSSRSSSSSSSSSSSVSSLSSPSSSSSSSRSSSLSSSSSPSVSESSRSSSSLSSSSSSSLSSSSLSASSLSSSSSSSLSSSSSSSISSSLSSSSSASSQSSSSSSSSSLSSSSSSGGFSYLLNDEFTTTESGPIASPRTCEPGPDTLVAVQTAGNISISGSKLVLPAGNLSWTTSGVYGGTARARKAGQAHLGAITLQSTGGIGMFGVVDNTGINTTDFTLMGGIEFQGLLGAGYIFRLRSDAGRVRIGQYQSGVTYQLASITRATGGFHLIKGGDYTEWQILHMEVFGDDDDLRIAFTNFNLASGATLQYLRVPDDTWAPTPILSDELSSATVSDGLAVEEPGGSGIARQTIHGSVSTDGSNMTATLGTSPAYAITVYECGESDVVVGAKMRSKVGENSSIALRVTDKDNMWIARLNNSNTKLELVERNAGVETVRADVSETGIAEAEWTVTAYMKGSQIYVDTDHNVWLSYDSATFNQTATKHGFVFEGTTSIARSFYVYPICPDVPAHFDDNEESSQSSSSVSISSASSVSSSSSSSSSQSSSSSSVSSSSISSSQSSSSVSSSSVSSVSSSSSSSASSLSSSSSSSVSSASSSSISSSLSSSSSSLSSSSSSSSS